MNDSDKNVPNTSVTGLSSAVPQRGQAQERILLELDRARLALHGVNAKTCVQCGGGLPKLSHVHVVRKQSLKGRQRVALNYSICSACWAENLEVNERVNRAHKVSNVFYIIQVLLLGLALGTEISLASVLLPVAGLLFLSTWAGASFYRRFADKVSPRLIALSADRVTLSVPRSWGQVLSHENPALLKTPPQLE